ncbi:MAG: cytochrome-c oxidase [Desulfuromonas sp.]|uniref:cytochrome C oxidase subunit IV family protein n=1 Tax=Desulfuromonas sp. TaxID=892 RepID=UPI000CCA1AE5|nr:cytochrome C oxidase subunit IV family protein [Desulfuromonas sp.]PLX86766.1 MAG: cytochrome-c oxidase [Desulfuromonas sp.]
MTEKAPHIVNSRTFVIVWLLLLALTAATVGASRLDLGPLNIWAALGIASVKSALVIAFFMHMKYEGRLLRICLLATLVVLAIFIGFTFFDVLYR